MIDVLIADDERIARETIKLLLKDQPDIGNIYLAADGEQAIALAKEHNPQLIFLDIQMPGKTGIEAVGELAEEAVVIFATAYDQYAIAAFELNAVDYLLKPFDDDRFYQSLLRARLKIASQDNNQLKDMKKLVTLLSQEPEKQYKSQLIVKDPGRIRLIDVASISHIQGAGNYADIHLQEGGHLLHRATLTTLESQLDPQEFIRIHRSTIVKRSCVKELNATENGDYVVTLCTGAQLTLSRRNKSKLDLLIS